MPKRNNAEPSPNDWAPDPPPQVSRNGPSVGQSEPYNNTNASNVNQKRAQHDWTAGEASGAESSQPSGWKYRPPSKRY